MLRVDMQTLALSPHRWGGWAIAIDLIVTVNFSRGVGSLTTLVGYFASPFY